MSVPDKEVVEDDGAVIVNRLTLWFPDGAVTKALEILYANSFENQANRKIYALQKELQVYVAEFNALRGKIIAEPGNVEDGKFTKEGQKKFQDLCKGIGSEPIKVQSELPIKVKFLDCFSSNDRIALESFGIAEFED